ncbi:Thymosin beta-like 1 [Homarus americanus]|uniref:Thymosin beta-like 1 n=1 Tax=Homarus americanus TaxID=6706 RepID=A0A8J5JKT7_HOMAM|nr:Thymosin beta-like 1 [Homarus americanus]
MSTETHLKDLPKVDTALKGQLEAFTPDKLKKIDTEEKVTLPTKDDVEQEKQHLELVDNIKQFRSDKLKRTSTSEKIVLPTPEGMVSTEARLSIIKLVSTRHALHPMILLLHTG